MGDNVNGTNKLGICYGVNTNWANYPYAAALRYTSGSACCSGTIISLNPNPNDIAIVRLQNPITTSGATAQNIPPVETTQGTLRVTGYGVDQSGGIPNNLQTMQSDIIEQGQCNAIMAQALGGGTYIDASMVCIRAGGAGVENVPTMCSGDSGGPMASGNMVYGANSWVLQGSGTGCNSCNCCPGYPQVAANVAHAADWINGYVGAWKKGDFNYTRSQ